MKALWLERMLKRLNEPKVFAVTIAVAVLIVTPGAVYFFKPVQFPTFFVTSNSTDWKATFEVVNDSDWHTPRNWTGFMNIYITVFKPNGTLELATKRVSEMSSDQSYSGIRLFDLGDIGYLDDGDYFTFEKSIYPADTRVIVEGHGSDWGWAISFGL